MLVTACAATAAHAEEVAAPSTDDHSASEVISPAPWKLRPAWKLRPSSQHISSRSLLAGTSPATDHTNDTPLGLVGKALERSDALKAESLRVEAREHAAQAEHARLLPKLSLETGLEKSNGRYAGAHASASVGVTAEWTIYSSGANLAAINAAHLRAESAAFGYLAAERRAALEVIETQMRLELARRQYSHIAGTLARLRDIRTATQTLEKSGFASRTDLAQLDAEIESVRAELQEAKSQREQEVIAYRDIVGTKPPAKLPRLNGARLLPQDVEAMMARALNGNYRVKAAQSAALAADAERDAVRGQYLPRVSLYGSAIADDAYGEDWTVGMKLTVPLVDYAAMPRYREANANAYASYFERADIERRVRRELAGEWARHRALLRQQHSYSRQAKALRRSTKGLRKQLEAGLRPVDDVLREEIELASALIAADRSRIAAETAAWRIAVHFPDLTLADFSIQ